MLVNPLITAWWFQIHFFSSTHSYHYTPCRTFVPLFLHTRQAAWLSCPCASQSLLFPHSVIKSLLETFKVSSIFHTIPVITWAKVMHTSKHKATGICSGITNLTQYSYTIWNITFIGCIQQHKAKSSFRYPIKWWYSPDSITVWQFRSWRKQYTDGKRALIFYTSLHIVSTNTAGKDILYKIQQYYSQYNLSIICYNTS
jgi:hypothetical protein